MTDDDKFKSIKFDLFPADVSVERGLISESSEVAFEEEISSIGRSNPQRLREFSVGRALARKALSHFGAPAFPLRSKSNRLPDWPSGFVGSITHKRNACLAAVARSSEYMSLGLDLEFCEDSDVKIISEVCTEAEIAWLRCKSESDLAHFANIFLAAKEAVFKMQFPITANEDLLFDEVEVSIFQDERRFEAKFLKDCGDLFPASSIVQGRIVLLGNWIAAGALHKAQ